ncbi:MAG: hypothetical protein LAN64_10580 [Acidobacteriia bacterium]|nr:hypothetical protein [Terriglobia bacterium]
MKFNLRNLEKFLNKALITKLERDLLKLRMVKEADLECRVYYHLSHLLVKYREWKLFARKYSRHTGTFSDFLLFENEQPRVAIELKWNRSEISKKDRKSLGLCIKQLRVNKAYFITTLIGGRKYRKISKQASEKNYLFELVVQLPLAGSELERWKRERGLYMSQMQFRTRRRDRAVKNKAVRRKRSGNS